MNEDLRCSEDKIERLQNEIVYFSSKLKYSLHDLKNFLDSMDLEQEEDVIAIRECLFNLSIELDLAPRINVKKNVTDSIDSIKMIIEESNSIIKETEEIESRVLRDISSPY